MTDSRLARELLLIVTIKLAALAILWWVFVRDATPRIDEPAVVSRLTTTAPATQGHPHGH